MNQNRKGPQMKLIPRQLSRRSLYGTVAVAALIAVAVVVVNLDSATAQDTGRSAYDIVDTTAAVESANWSEGVTITVDEQANTFRFESNGIPSHGFADQYLIPNNPNEQPFSDKPASAFTVANSADYFTASTVETDITTLPTYVDTVTDTTLGRIGVVISGAQLFNDYEDFERTNVALNDQVTHDHVSFVDECNGHTLVDGTSYHYHGVPLCITETLDQAGEHSLMIGVLEDGFPVYGNQGQSGATVTNADLDECSGHVGITPEFPDGIYHYHLTADEAPYTIDCYHGEVEVTAMQGGPNGGAPDFAAAATTLGVSETALISALGGSMPPDFEAAAQELGISVDDLRNALPAPGVR